MSVKTKMSMVSVAIILATLGLFQMQRNSDDNYMLSVSWKPGVLLRQNPVHITVKVDGFPIINRPYHLSPWSERMTAASGAPVVLVATTASPGLFHMDCMIMRNNRSVPSGGFDSIDGPGQVRCVA